MGFEFGVITDLDFTITLYCFVIVVAFVLIMEYVIGVMEYFLEGSKLYTNMIQMIYKELMLMGLVTFAVVMYEAAPSGGLSEEEEKWLEAIDFSHIYLFFVTFFFVLHAFYLMFTSMIAVSEYRSMFCEEAAGLIEDLDKALAKPLQRLLFGLNFIPQLTNIRDRAEFSMIHQLFMSRYLVPEDFDFPYYLSGCFDRFALRTIDRSKFTWIALVLIVLVNYFRVLAGLSCTLPGEDSNDRRLLLQQQQQQQEQQQHQWQQRLLGSEDEAQIDECRKQQYYLFLISGGLLVLYTVILICFTRLYKMRLIHQVNIGGHQCKTPKDYSPLLKRKLRKADDEKECLLNLLRMPSPDLKDAIEKEFDQNEEGEEDEEGFKFLGELLRWFLTEIHEKYIEFRIWVVKAISSCVSRNQQAANESRAGSILFTKSAESHPHHHHHEHNGQHDGHHHHHSHNNSQQQPHQQQQQQQHGSDARESSTTANSAISPRSASKPHTGGASIEQQQQQEEEEYISLKYRLNSAVILAAVTDVSLNNSRTSQDSNQPLIQDAQKDHSTNPLQSPLVTQQQQQQQQLQSFAVEGSNTAASSKADAVTGSGNNINALPNRVMVDYDRLAKQHLDLRQHEEHEKEKAASCCCCCCCGSSISSCCCARRASSPHFNSSIVESLAESISFNNIYLFKRPVLYFRAVEMQIMLTCMYLALWSTSFITIVKDTGYNDAQHFIYQVLMLFPVAFAFRSIAYVAETCSLILAMSDLNLEVIAELLADKEDMAKLTDELREKMMYKIREWFEQTHPDEEQQAQFVHQMFVEIDQDGSGSIDKNEFRLLLRKLNLKYSNHRFDLLFRAVDSVGGDGEISEPELTEFLFPGSANDSESSDEDSCDADASSESASAGVKSVVSEATSGTAATGATGSKKNRVPKSVANFQKTISSFKQSGSTPSGSGSMHPMSSEADDSRGSSSADGIAMTSMKGSKGTKKAD